jgi:hypothetical protein
MAEVTLDRPNIGSLVHEIESRAVAKHMRRQSCLCGLAHSLLFCHSEHELTVPGQTFSRDCLTDWLV